MPVLVLSCAGIGLVTGSLPPPGRISKLTRISRIRIHRVAVGLLSGKSVSKHRTGHAIFESFLTVSQLPLAYSEIVSQSIPVPSKLFPFRTTGLVNFAHCQEFWLRVNRKQRSGNWISFLLQASGGRELICRVP
jgi:hypothetical protein